MFFAKQLYEMTHIDLGYDTDSIVKVHFERYERKQPTTEAEYLKQTSLRKASKENISTAMNASPLFMGHRTKRILRIERKEYQTY